MTSFFPPVSSTTLETGIGSADAFKFAEFTGEYTTISGDQQEESGRRQQCGESSQSPFCYSAGTARRAFPLRSERILSLTWRMGFVFCRMIAIHDIAGPFRQEFSKLKWPRPLARQCSQKIQITIPIYSTFFEFDRWATATSFELRLGWRPDPRYPQSNSWSMVESECFISITDYGLRNGDFRLLETSVFFREHTYQIPASISSFTPLTLLILETLELANK